MRTLGVFFFSVLSTATAALAPHSSYENHSRMLRECSDGQEELKFEFYTDSRPQDNGWKLICDDAPDVLVWDVEPGDLTNSKEFLLEAVCVANTTTCVLNLTDTTGDGLDAIGWYSFTLGATTVAVHKFGTPESFEEHSFCVGPNCDMEPIENGDDDETDKEQETFCGDDEYDLSWTILLNNDPEVTSWQLDCDGSLIWNVPAGSYSAISARSRVSQSACISKSIGYCRLTLDGGVGQGSSPGDWYELKLGAHTLAVFNADEPIEITEHVFCFGPQCDAAAGEKCDQVWLEIELDDSPLDTRAEIICDGEIIFKHIPTDQTQAHDWITFDRCIDANACCKLVVYDDGNNGLTGGYYYLQEDGKAAAYHDSDHPFSRNTVAFAGSLRKDVCTPEIASGRA